MKTFFQCDRWPRWLNLDKRAGIIIGLCLLLTGFLHTGWGQETNGDANSVTDLRRRGVKALEDGIHSAAIRFFMRYRQAVDNREPQLADATALLVDAQYKAGQIAEADEALKYQLEHSSGLTDPYYQHLIIYWRAAIDLEMENEDGLLERVDELLQKHPEKDDIRLAALELRGRILSKQRKWQAAEATFRSIIEEFGSDPADAGYVIGAKLGLAETLKDSGKSQEALELLTAINADTKIPVAARTKAQLYMIAVYIARNELDAAVATYRSVAPQQPKIADANWFATISELFTSLAKTDNPEQALELVPGLLVNAPNPVQGAQTMLGEITVLMAMGQLAESGEKLATLRKKLDPKTEKEIFPQLINTEFQLAAALVKAGEITAAAERLHALVSDERADNSLRYRAAMNLGNILYNGNAFDDAVKAFAEATRLAGTREDQAQALYAAGNTAFTKAEQTAPNSDAARPDYGRAASFFKNVAEKFPELPVAESAWFRLGLARARAGLHQEAAQVLKDFLAKYPESKHRQEAALERIVALRLSGEMDEAMASATAFATAFPDNPLAAAALMEGFHAAKTKGDYPRANGFLSLIIEGSEKFAESGLPPHALYERIHLHFLYGRTEAALTDAESFLKQFTLLPLAADVRLWLGDHYFAAAEQAISKTGRGSNARTAVADQLFQKALESYLDVATNNRGTPQAFRALYEAARIKNILDDPKAAQDLCNRLLKQLPAESSPRLQCLASTLLGDLESERGNYAAAGAHFKQAAAVSSDDNLSRAAHGRQADMLVARGAMLAEEAPERAALLAEAVKIYDSIAASPEAGPMVIDSAVFRAGKALEMKGDKEGALEKYLIVLYDFQRDLAEDSPRTWYYFARSGHAAAEILVQQENYEQALRCYARIAESGVPSSEEAKAREAAIRSYLDGQRPE